MTDQYLAPPPRREGLTVDDLTDLVKYIYAVMTQAFADLQYPLAELTATGKLDPEANEALQWGWCFPIYEELYYNTVTVVRREHDTDDHDWGLLDNTYANGLQVKNELGAKPDLPEFHGHGLLCGDGAINDYSREHAYHIAQPPFYADGRARDAG